MKGDIICSKCESAALWACATCGRTYCDACREDVERLRCEDCGGVLKAVETEAEDVYDGTDDDTHDASAAPREERVRYRRRPAEVDAVRYTGDNYEEISAFTLGGAQMTADAVYVAATGGTLNLGKGDYVVRGAKGDYFVLKSDTFDAFFEPNQ